MEIGSSIGSAGFGNSGLAEIKRQIQEGIRTEGIKSPEIIRLGKTQKAQSPSFGDVMGGVVKTMDEKAHSYDNELKSVLMGESNNIHKAMMVKKESEVYFKLGIEVRNKLVEAFQTLMRMSV